jgi:predicted nucleic acid-binding protein
VGLILDTNALSAAAAEREPGALEIVARAERLAVPVIVLGNTGLGSRSPGIGQPTRAGFGSGSPR